MAFGRKSAEIEELREQLRVLEEDYDSIAKEADDRLAQPEYQQRLITEARTEAVSRIETKRDEAYKLKLRELYDTLKGQELARALTIAQLNHEFDLLRSVDLSSDYLNERLLPGDFVELSLGWKATDDVATISFEWTVLGDKTPGLRQIGLNADHIWVYDVAEDENVSPYFNDRSRLFELGTLDPEVSGEIAQQSRVSPGDTLLLEPLTLPGKLVGPKVVYNKDPSKVDNLKPAHIVDIEFKMRDLPEPSPDTDSPHPAAFFTK